MKIIYISLSSSPGMQRYSRNICNESIKSNNVFLLCTKNYDLYDFDKQVNILNIVSTKNPRLELNTLNIFEIQKVFRIIKGINPDIIHFLSDHPWNPILTYLLKKFRILHTIHDPMPHPNEFSSLFKKMNNFLVIKVLKQNIILHGSSYINFLTTKYNINLNNTFIIPLGTELRTNINISLPSENVILFFGRIKPYKGLENFIKAVEIISSKNKNIKAIIAGEGSMDAYKSIIKNQSIFEIYNYSIPEDKISELFIRAKVVVLPYKSATQSGIIPMSYYHGKPVVATNVGSLSEVVENDITGYLVNVNPVEIANKIEEIIFNDELYLRLSENTKRKLNDELTTESMVGKFNEIYKSMAYNVLRESTSSR